MTATLWGVLTVASVVILFGAIYWLGSRIEPDETHRDWG